MSLKFKYLSKDQVPVEHAALYVERDGAVVLDVEEAVAREKLDEFRQNNISLANQLKAFEGIDAAKARELLKKQAELEEEGTDQDGGCGENRRLEAGGVPG